MGSSTAALRKEIARIQREQNVCNAELARRLGISRATIGVRLSGPCDITIGKAAETLHALGYRIHWDLRPIDKGE